MRPARSHRALGLSSSLANFSDRPQRPPTASLLVRYHHMVFIALRTTLPHYHSSFLHLPYTFPCLIRSSLAFVNTRLALAALHATPNAVRGALARARQQPLATGPTQVCLFSNAGGCHQEIQNDGTSGLWRHFQSKTVQSIGAAKHRSPQTYQQQQQTIGPGRAPTGERQKAPGIHQRTFLAKTQGRCLRMH